MTAILCSGAYAQDTAGNNLEGFTAGPYLMSVTRDSAVVAFHIKQPLPAKVKFLTETR